MSMPQLKCNHKQKTKFKKTKKQAIMHQLHKKKKNEHNQICIHNQNRVKIIYRYIISQNFRFNNVKLNRNVTFNVL